MQDNEYYGAQVEKFSLVMPRHRDLMRMVCPEVQGRSVLDLGCGCGITSGMMSKYADEVVGVDACPEFIEYAKRMYGEDVEFHCYPVGEVDMGRCFDVIALFDVLEHLSPDEFQRVWRTIKRHSHDGTMVLINYPYPPYTRYVEELFPELLQPTDELIPTDVICSKMGEMGYQLSFAEARDMDHVGVPCYLFMAFDQFQVPVGLIHGT